MRSDECRFFWTSWFKRFPHSFHLGMTFSDANDSRLSISTLRRSSTVKKVSKRAPALPLPTPEGNSKEQVVKYR